MTGLCELCHQRPATAQVTRVVGNRRTTENPCDVCSSLGHEYCRDLTRLASEGKLEPVVGRATEIETTLEILSRHTKKQPHAHRRAGRGQDGHRGGHRPAHHLRRRAVQEPSRERPPATH